MDWQQASCYLNGSWTTVADAKISVLDRGFIFGDGVYEVVAVDTIGRLRAPFRAAAHVARLARNLAAVRIDNPLPAEGWLALFAQLIERNPWPRQLLYVQVTRGAAKRDHAFPAGVAPTVFATSSPWPEIPAEQLEQGIAVVTHPDERWLHCDIKTTSLLGNVLMKQFAVDHGASETLLFRDGALTEGSSANAHVVTGGTIAAPAKSHLILPGITYDTVFEIAQERGARCEVRTITDAQLRSADEIWISSSGRELLAVTRLDGRAVGSGRPGPLFKQMHAWFQQAKQADAARWAQQLPTLGRLDARAA